MQTSKPTRYLKLPFLFNEKRLVEEVETILRRKWTPHFNTGGYEGSWNSIALYAPEGKENYIQAMPDEKSTLQETAALKEASYIKEVLNCFECEFLSVRLLRLEVGAFIKPHRDYQLGYENGCFRLHIPIITHDKIEFILDNDHLMMLPGECWYTNVNYVHSVANKGTKDRIHLVVDGARNSWSDELFFSLAPKASFFPEQRESYSPETKQRIIEALKRMDTPASKSLIKKMSQD
ncbi:aspartyl/asparaginyl beta-hydroxylase domain-containing protein [Ascidiimonas sp. W6]|uniref:aspartyl/asparaginyl beta-hydroxylase domain-containing protein n=1 Tax=Ascidiimonas meishanensis TaxID=3128903 RepID=UPI0030ED76CE